MIKGYITLKQASEMSGRTVDALKKQCQEGRIRGSIKQGNSWFVPQGEIIVDDETTINGTLAYLITLAESLPSDTASTTYGIVIFMNGVIISGDLTSRERYLNRFKQDILSNTTFSGFEGANESAVKFREFTDKYFDNMGDNKESGMPTFLHLDNVIIWHGDSTQELQPGLLRIKSSEINGFMLGKPGVIPRSDNE